MVTQITTETTLDLDDAIETLHNEPKAARVEINNETVFIRAVPEEDHREGYLISTVIGVIGERRDFTVDDVHTVREIIATADAAVLVRVNNSPWSPLYDDDTA